MELAGYKVLDLLGCGGIDKSEAGNVGVDRKRFDVCAGGQGALALAQNKCKGKYELVIVAKLEEEAWGGIRVGGFGILVVVLEAVADVVARD